jgi:hypothetical protein
MKTALCLLLAAGMVSGASIEGRVFDPSTAVIPDSSSSGDSAPCRTAGGGNEDGG